ncbi:hypothetical protein SERLA73DRAFT_46050 [Serpula lacrymans var. lacrymans S7.3]|uniref:FHA domain-containing protein n=2 Tax=Serpula lacrymans var. lacrymans TaxID=341189 RepID=F8PII7_SERL3|nr:hypothetical protein SERLA73DRAFT_46050 [Serpula lacrymans var. lacrymans S7.3]
MSTKLSPSITLSPSDASFSFHTKSISLPPNTRVLLSPELNASEKSSTANGWFPASSGSVSLSAPHAEIWAQAGQVLIRDHRSLYGTYVNGIKIEQQTLLQSGDIVTLGVQLRRSKDIPNYITDQQLKPIIATVTLKGI